MGATSVVFYDISRVPSGEHNSTENSRVGTPSPTMYMYSGKLQLWRVGERHAGTSRSLVGRASRSCR
eukprot:2651442-Prymnesium_polylepis.1